ncbi:hypothetical protein Tco_0941442 [Tanacetum coccineum]|uniref:Uncharacterized protein n=1 Tax=Tanacetum coccineum TaxID=301880 RepID=A0ABQ5DR08_9ASTR
MNLTHSSSGPTDLAGSSSVRGLIDYQLDMERSLSFPLSNLKQLILKAKAEKRKNVWESYKKRTEFVRKLRVINNIKIISNTKPMKVTVIRDHDD